VFILLLFVVLWGIGTLTTRAILRIDRLGIVSISALVATFLVLFFYEIAIGPIGWMRVIRAYYEMSVVSCILAEIVLSIRAIVEHLSKFKNKRWPNRSK
jgi:uncharacterized membrane protein